MKYKPDEYRYKVITDPVHGDIGLSQLEVDLIDTASFQRLRRLKQLGLASMVYPGADHSRFSHSLGVFYIMGRAIDLLVRRKKFDNKERRMMRLVALLHDIGHYPYSHLMEYIDRDPLRSTLLASKATRKVQRYPDHEELGEIIITTRADIASRLKSAKIDPPEIASIVRGRHTTIKYGQLIHSTLDLDRMDYLVRDAISTGVPFGRIDLSYLLNNLDISRDGRIVVRRKAASAIEHFVVARYLMSKAVYLHKTVFAFEALMRQILFLLRQRSRALPSGERIEKLVRHPVEFLGFHDGMIDSLVEKTAEREPETSALGRLCRAIRDRKPPCLVLEQQSLTDREGDPPEEFTRFVTRRKDRLARTAEKCGIPVECWLSEDPKAVSFERLGPLMPLAEAADIDAAAIAELVQVIGADGNPKPLIDDPSSIIHHLSRLTFRMARLYVVEDDKAKIAKAKREVEGWLKC